MKHLKKGRKFHRKRDQRKALLKSLGEALILKEKIITTESRAKELKRFIEKKITMAKKNSLSAHRNLRRFFSSEASRKLIKEIVPLIKNRKGGYTRIIKIAPRKRDKAEMAKIEIVK
ncbi:50S ribosomal protein L17 [bacterium]|nr:50S ribosomal protein L17 [bacterium]